MSRPEKPLDWKRVNKLLNAGCKGTEIAASFDMHPVTFYEKVQEKFKVNFTEYSAIKRSEGDSLIREAQYDKALDGDNTMLIWLGKHRLEQKEDQSEWNKPQEETKVAIQDMKNAANNSEPETSQQLEGCDLAP